MAIAGGYSWVFDAGLGTHSCSPEFVAFVLQKTHWQSNFSQRTTTSSSRQRASTSFLMGSAILLAVADAYVRRDPGILAKLGPSASAFLWSEIVRFLSGRREQIMDRRHFGRRLYPRFALRSRDKILAVEEGARRVTWSAGCHPIHLLLV